MKNILFVLVLITAISSGFSQESYELAPASKLSIDGTSTVHDWTVTANTLEGAIEREGDNPKEITFAVAVGDIKSERGATMDKKMHAALKKDTHPKVVFRLNEIKGGTTLIGTLTIAGKEKEVTVSSEISVVGEELNISGEYPIALQDFDIVPPTAMFGQVIVGDEVTVKFDLVFQKQ